MKNIIKIISLSSLLIIALQTQKSSFAQDEKPQPPAGEQLEKTEEEIADEAKKKEIEERAKTDTYNLNYYPKTQLSAPNLFTGAATLKGNEVFGRLGLISFFLQGKLDSKGAFTASTENLSYLLPTASVGWGIIDNLFFSATVPYKFYLAGQGNGVSDPWLSLKWRILNDPFIFSLQLEGKLPLGKATKVPPFGEGQADAGIMALVTRSFEPFYIQLGAGFKYRFPLVIEQNKVLSTVNYAHQIPYMVDIGYFLPGFKNLGFNITAYGYYPVGYGNPSSNLLSLLPNINYKNSNYDINLSFNKIIIGSNIDTGWGIQGGFTYKTSFEYPKVFNLLLLPKIDVEDLDKKKDLSAVENGKQLYINNCAKCHILVNPDAFKMDKWEPIIDRYRDKKLISKREHEAILEFLTTYTEEQTK
jgi:hypothetical protein